MVQGSLKAKLRPVKTKDVGARPALGAKRNAYQRKYMAARRAEWLSKNGPCKTCGTWLNLQVDHVDPKTKKSHAVWSWKKERMLAELSKCQVLCRPCHQIKTNKDNGFGKHNRSGYSRGCRCDICRADKVIEVNEYRWRVGTRKKRPPQPTT